jgi:hypothetical protein
MRGRFRSLGTAAAHLLRLGRTQGWRTHESPLGTAVELHTGATAAIMPQRDGTFRARFEFQLELGDASENGYDCAASLAHALADRVLWPLQQVENTQPHLLTEDTTP